MLMRGPVLADSEAGELDAVEVELRKANLGSGVGKHVVVRGCVRTMGPYWQVLQPDWSFVANEPWGGQPLSRDKIGMPRRK